MKRSAILSLFGAVLVLGLGVLVVPSFLQARDARSELSSQRQRWEAAEIESYRYVGSRVCLCDEPHDWVVEIRNGEVTSIVPLDDEAEFEPRDVPSFFAGSDRLFSLAEGVIGDDEYELRYDEQTGLPTRIYGDPDIDTSDDQLLVIVSDIERLPRDERADLGPRERWAEAALTDYRYLAEYHCDCDRPFLWSVEVRDGSVVELHPLEAAEEYDHDDLPWELAGAGNLFAWAEGMGSDEAAFVLYDDTTGFPLHIGNDESPARVVVREFEVTPS